MLDFQRPHSLAGEPQAAPPEKSAACHNSHFRDICFVGGRKARWLIRNRSFSTYHADNSVVRVLNNAIEPYRTRARHAFSVVKVLGDLIRKPNGFLGPVIRRRFPTISLPKVRFAGYVYLTSGGFAQNSSHLSRRESSAKRHFRSRAAQYCRRVDMLQSGYAIESLY